MSSSAYKVVEVIGTSENSWEEAARNAVETAAQSLKHMRIAEVKELDMTVGADGRVMSYRAKMSLSFKYVPGG
ncbi:dodecin family protein [Nitrococcus mobilis]|uniref:Transporter n=1 Tax=Nitrococcus mobilis Nb-231 TaxID=314278 RepID=A4BLG9_9GAMM|nr:dodecin family protein [Nitrococcus mobilis]EAR23157.1 hypothetical protein NB231_15093 [Nitrococcus mobilis Nb-231]